MSIYRVIWIILMGSYGLGCFFFYIGRNIEIGNRIRWQRRFLLWKKIFTYQILKYKEKILQEKKLELRKKAIRNDIEIFHSSIMLKNLAIAERGNAFSADYMYEKLLEQANRLRPIYAEMLTLYRGGRDKEAFTLFATVFFTIKSSDQVFHIHGKFSIFPY